MVGGCWNECGEETVGFRKGNYDVVTAAESTNRIIEQDENSNGYRIELTGGEDNEDLGKGIIAKYANATDSGSPASPSQKSIPEAPDTGIKPLLGLVILGEVALVVAGIAVFFKMREK